MPARLRLSWSMKSLKLFLLPVLDSLEFGWQLIRYTLILPWPSSTTGLSVYRDLARHNVSHLLRTTFAESAAKRRAEELPMTWKYSFNERRNDLANHNPPIIQVAGNDIFRVSLIRAPDTALGQAKVRILQRFRGGNAKGSGKLLQTA